MQSRFLLSLIAALAGWFTAILLCLLRAAPASQEFGVTLLFFALYSGLTIAVIYAVLLLPLALSIPASSRLWLWSICVPCCFVGGCALMWLLFFRSFQDLPMSWVLIVLGRVPHKALTSRALCSQVSECPIFRNSCYARGLQRSIASNLTEYY